MKRLARLILGLISAGLAAGLIGASAIVLMMSQLLPDRPDDGLEGWVNGMFVFGIILTLYGLVAAAVIGIPAHLILNRMKRTGWLSYIGVGLAAGVLLAFVFGGLSALVAAGAAAGIAGASAFWLVVRPDQKHLPAT